MLLVYGTTGLVLAMLTFGITLIGSRNPQEPAWVSDFLVANVYVPVMVALAVLGTASIVQFMLSLGKQSLGVKEIVLLIGITGVGLLLMKLLHIKQRLSAYEASRRSAEIITPTVFSGEKDNGEKHEPPVKPTSGKMAA